MNPSNTFAFAMLALSLARCAPSNSKGNAAITGRIVGGGSAARADTIASTVTAFTVAIDGKLTAISSAATIDDSGRYTVKVSLDGTTSDIVVQASVGGAVSARAILSAALEINGQGLAAPANTETTIEADVFIDARTQGIWDANTTTAGLRRLIDASTAAAISTSATRAADVRGTAVVVVAALDARANASARVGVSASQLQAFMTSETAAQAQLDRVLDGATSDAAVATAVQANETAVASGSATSGISDAQFSYTTALFVHAGSSFAAPLSGASQNAWRRHAAQLRADAEARANASALEALAASASVTSHEAEIKLALDASIDASGGTQANLDAALATYHAQLKADFESSVAALKAGAAVAVDTTLASANSLAVTFSAGLSAAGSNTDQMAQALAEYLLGVSTTVNADASLGSLNATQIGAAATLVANLDFPG